MATHSIRSWIFAFVILAVSASAFAQIGISISFGPPPLPVYEQPPCPEEGYIWTPGYWAYDNDYSDYYWVPGTWVMAPQTELFWTPGYWAWNDGGFRFYDGYWGPQVGFYGGIDYGYGYFGEGYEGGRWDHGHFFYNRSVNNVNVTVIHNVYNTTVINRTTVNRVSYNGGNGGVSARPTPQQEAVARERHIAPVAAQTQHIQDARADRQLRASENHGKPPIAATAKPSAFRDRSVVPAREAGGPYTPPANRANANDRPRENAQPNGGNAERNNNNSNDRNRGGTFVHPNDLPPRDRPAPPNTGDAKRDTKYQQQQEKLNAKQDQERQKLQQRQDQEHQKIAKQNADEAKNQQAEQRHQQQTQQLQQRQDQQRQKMEQKQQPRQNRPQPQKEQHPTEEKH